MVSELDELYAELSRREEEYAVLARVLARIKAERDKVSDEILAMESKPKRGGRTNG